MIRGRLHFYGEQYYFHQGIFATEGRQIFYPPPTQKILPLGPNRQGGHKQTITFQISSGAYAPYAPRLDTPLPSTIYLP